MQFFSNLIGHISWEEVILGALRVLLVLVVFWIAMSLVKMGLRRLEENLVRRGKETGDVPNEAEKRAETLVRLLRQAVLIMLWIVAGLVVLRQFGVEIGPILASAGVAGVAVGFGAQNLVRDIISGFFMILENQVRVGDVAIINGTGGLVEQINFRTIILRDLSGTVHVFPNGTVNTMSNMTREWSAYVYDIGVAYKEDVDEVIQLIQKVGAELKEDSHYGPLMVADLEVFGVDNFADSAVVIKGRLRTKPIKQWEVGREFRRRIKHAFDKAGIEIPFPHRSIYFGEASGPVLAQLVNQRSLETREGKPRDEADKTDDPQN
ncbi:MAG TPA: mechanosensitive ion channel family protein [Candidatus Krumholzibacteria bacterium]|nr:mechanosensitive ion channel family protein [Candidatus Krumholzibacteria bacterium]